MSERSNGSRTPNARTDCVLTVRLERASEDIRMIRVMGAGPVVSFSSPS